MVYMMDGAGWNEVGDGPFCGSYWMCWDGVDDYEKMLIHVWCCCSMPRHANLILDDVEGPFSSQISRLMVADNGRLGDMDVDED